MKYRYLMRNIFIILLLVAALVFCGFFFPTLSFFYQNKSYQTKAGHTAVEEKNFVFSSDIKNTLKIFSTDFSTVACPSKAFRHTESEIYESSLLFFRDLEKICPVRFMPDESFSHKESGIICVIGDHRGSYIYDELTGTASVYADPYSADATASDSDPSESPDSEAPLSDKAYTAYIWKCEWYLPDVAHLEFYVDDQSSKIVAFQYYFSDYRELSAVKEKFESALSKSALANRMVRFFEDYYQLHCSGITVHTSNDPKDKKYNYSYPFYYFSTTLAENPDITLTASIYASGFSFNYY